MTPEHEKFLQWFETRAPFIAVTLRSHWAKGKQYYIDSRVNIRGKRMVFNRLNKMMEV